MESTLFDEVIEEIGKDAKIIRDEERKKICTILHVFFHFDLFSIEWEKINKKVQVNAIEEVIPAINILAPNAHMEAFVLSYRAKLPLLKAKLTKILAVIDTLTVLGSRTWIFCPISRYAIEYHDLYGHITIGVAPDLNIKLEVAYKAFLQTKIKKKNSLLSIEILLATL